MHTQELTKYNEYQEHITDQVKSISFSKYLSDFHGFNTKKQFETFLNIPNLPTAIIDDLVAMIEICKWHES